MPAARPCLRRTGLAAGSRPCAPRELVGDRHGTFRQRRLDAEQLVGSGEIADRLGLRRVQTVHWWRKSDPTFQDPVAVLGARTGRPTYIWYWPDVQAWFRRRGGLGDR